MPAPRWAFFLTIAVGLPTVLTFFSLLHTHPRGDYVDGDQPRSGLGALFSFHTPSSLFPPSAIISLTDDNSTFFLARPADFGPSLLSSGLSGQLWAGSGLGDDDSSHGGAEGELGCSDVPGWDERHERFAATDLDDVDQSHAKKDTSGAAADLKTSKLPRSEGSPNKPQEEDGTDDHLHHPLPTSPVTKPIDAGDSTQRERDPTTHADIQSLQESAEIAGKIALLSRGGCGFLEKVKWAQRRGATALIVGDNTRGGALVTMYARGDTSNVTIPSVFTSHTTAQLLSSLIPAEDLPDDDAAEEVDQASTQKATKKTKKATSISRVKSHLRARGRSGSDMEAKRSTWALLLKFFNFRKGSQNSLHSESRRPPSSGRLDVHGEKQKGESKGDSSSSAFTQAAAPSARAPKSPAKASSHHSDDFVIGVQDWRDPDMVAAKVSNTKSSALSTAETPLSTEDLLRKGKAADAEKDTNAALAGGSITPGSGEYSKPGKVEKEKDTKTDGKTSKDSTSTEQESNSARPSADSDPEEEHEGLWVTITPTAMSTSPFFDTLLVLVVSPLVTLTVVYALLLLRSRIRRRRWRAPKSLVERLPIRTYHTMSASTTGTSTRFTSPDGSSPSSPLLQSSSRSISSRTRPRSATTTGVSEAVSASLEKATTKASQDQGEKMPPKKRKKYHTKHVECVVCLEEYVDGHSRIMSLPCGHEFHVECITPWLTTRRRTCPICKGDVVRSLQQSPNKDQALEGLQNEREVQTRAAETANNSPTAAIPIPRDGSGIEQQEDLAATLVNDDEPEATSSRSPWAGLASVSLGAFSGQAKDGKEHNDRNR